MPPNDADSPAPVVCAGVVVADHICTPIDHLPSAGELVAAEELMLTLGGCASNAAVDLAKLGVRARVCGRVGDDAFGRFVAETLAGQGVDTSALRVDPSRPTSQTLIVNVKGQDRRFIHSFGANRGLSVEDLEAAVGTSAPPRVFYLGGYLILPGLEARPLAEFFARLRAAGTLVVLDVATPGPGDYLKHLWPVLPETDVFLPNADEAALILGEADPIRQAEAFRRLGAHRVVITQGERGAVAVSDALRVRLGTYPMPYVDGSGGGDAFDAGYIAGVLDGRDELGCLKLAAALGASCVRALGTTAGVFERDEAEQFLASHELAVSGL
jgi:sugar/nucleoside kinase (ribokinase family)